MMSKIKCKHLTKGSVEVGVLKECGWVNDGVASVAVPARE